MAIGLIALALAQAVAGPPALPPSKRAEPTPTDRIAGCPATPPEDGDVVVCARKDSGEQYRLRPLTHRYDPVPGPGVGVKIGDGHANAYAVQYKSPDGKPDKRIMVTWTMPF